MERLVHPSGATAQFSGPSQDLSKWLPYASQAAFNSSSNSHDSLCLPNTRIEVREEITAWADGPNGRHIFWLSGMAGTGKSTVARTVARQWYEQKQLGASFFFSRGGGDVGHVRKFVTTLAWQLAHVSLTLKRYIYEAIAENRDIASQTLREQWSQLVFRPLSKLEPGPPKSSLVLVIDALDECEEDRDIQVILHLLAEMQFLESKRVRIFLTSRPEIPTRFSFDSRPEILYRDLGLYNAFRATVNRDISKFFQDEFREIRRDFEEQSADWPGDSKILLLVERANGSFIYAATICRLIRGGQQRPSQDLLDLFMPVDIPDSSPEWRYEATNKAATLELDAIYTQILRHSVQKVGEGQNITMLADFFKQVIGPLTILCEPLSAGALSRFLDVRQQIVNLGVRHLHSVLIVPNSQEIPIRLFHPSFRDFLCDESRCSDNSFFVDEKMAHAAAVNSCLRVMSKLRSDLCCLHEPSTLALVVGKAEIEQYLPAELQYACRFWAQHLQKSQIQLHDHGPIHTFLREHFLHWLEALSLMKRIADAVLAINSLESIAKATQCHNICAFIHDANRFILYNRSIIEKAPLQTYYSALIFIPEISGVQDQFKNQIPHWIHELPKAQSYWGPLEHTLKGHTGWVRSVAFSPDGSKLASASDDTTIQLWNVATGQAEQMLKGHTGWVRSIAFFPDGSKLASASGDRTVRLWDTVLLSASTGRGKRVLKGHRDGVNSVAVSPNGEKLASASGDGTIRLWNIAFWNTAERQTEETLAGYTEQILKGHTGGVNSVAFSPNGNKLASASDDTTIQLWDPTTGHATHTLKGHTGGICSIAFCPNGDKLASASGDATMRVWNATTGQVEQTLKDYAYRSWFRSVIFSHNASKLVSASDDGVIRVWNITTCQVEQTFKGHKKRVRSVAFSPNTNKLASASDDSIVQVWNIAIGQAEQTFNSYTGSLAPVLALGNATARMRDVVIGQVDQTLLKDQIEWVNSISFSLDGCRLASALNNSAVQIWNLATRQAEQTLKGHTGGVNSVAFSPNDINKLASASDDGNILVWNITTMKARQTLKGHTGWVRKVVFSPDGSKLASASSDATVKVWNSTTGQAEQTLEGHTDGVRSIAFSSNSSKLASASNDSTIRIWNVSTGQAEQTLDIGTSGINSIAFSPTGSKLASGLGNGTVQIWDVITGEVEHTLKGHIEGIRSVCFYPDGSKLASASVDTTIRVWNAVTGQTEHILKGHAGAVRSVAFPPDGSKLASASSDGTIRVWNVITGQAEQTIICYVD